MRTCATAAVEWTEQAAIPAARGCRSAWPPRARRAGRRARRCVKGWCIREAFCVPGYKGTSGHAQRVPPAASAQDGARLLQLELLLARVVCRPLHSGRQGRGYGGSTGGVVALRNSSHVRLPLRRKPGRGAAAGGPAQAGRAAEVRGGGAHQRQRRKAARSWGVDLERCVGPAN
jgi:hypothetical protein